MDYAQERVATLHDLRGGSAPDAPADRAAVVVPMTHREYGRLAAERVLSRLERVDPARVVVPVRAPADRVGGFRKWLSGFDLSLSAVWCNGPRVTDLVADAGLGGADDGGADDGGKGHDVWLALGLALAGGEEYVVVHDADARSYDESYVPRLLFPLARGYDFSKGYYARVEDGRLYGRLFRLFYAPLVRALADAHDAPILDYLGAFRYALAGEFAATRDLARSLRVERSWGLEVGTLGDAFDRAGFDGSAQVDLGTYEHEHRTVGGPSGLSTMAEAVGAALLRTVAARGVDPDYAVLPDRYRSVAREFVERYADDAAFNGLSVDVDAERDQVDAYADAVRPPGPDDRLPAWRDSPLDPTRLAEAAREDLAAAAAAAPPELDALVDPGEAE